MSDPWLYDDAGDHLTDDTGAWLSIDEYTSAVPPARTPVRYQLDVCENFERIGVCDVFEFAGVLHRNKVGEWQAQIPSGGIEFSGGKTIADVDSIMLWETNPARIAYPGSMVSGASSQSGLVTDIGPDGKRWTLSGVDLFSLLGTRLAYPTPATEPPWVDAYDTRTGVASSVAAAYIANNIGSSALTIRRVPNVQTIDGIVGGSITWSARLQPLDSLIADICNAADIVCLPSMPTPGTIRYTFTTGSDRTAQTILSDRDLSGNFKIATIQPRASFVIAGGSGEGVARTFAVSSSGDSGIDRNETFYDVNNLTGATAVDLAAQGHRIQSAAETSVEFGRVLPTQWRYPDTFEIGDRITVEADNVRYPVLVDGVSFTVNANESMVRPLIGRTVNNEAVQIMRQLWGTSDRLNANIS